MEYSYNDWRYFLEHKEGSKYDWSSGTNPPDYNHDYWEKHKEEIMAKRRQKNGAVRDFGSSGVGYKAKKDGTNGSNLSDYENDTDWTDELTPDELKNIEAHNKQVDDNIAQLTKTIENYINANKGKLTPDQIAKLRADLNTQISIANEQRINTKNSDDYNYVMDLRKKNGGSSRADSSTQSAPKQSTSRNSTSKSSSSSSTTKPKKTQEQMKQEEWERMTETKRKEAEEFAKQREAANKAKEDNFNYDNEEARRRKEEQERIRRSGRSTK